LAELEPDNPNYNEDALNEMYLLWFARDSMWWIYLYLVAFLPFNPLGLLYFAIMPLVGRPADEYVWFR